MIKRLLISLGTLLYITAAHSQASLRDQALEFHNHWRSLHQAPPLVWDSTLEQYARQHAQVCVFKHSNSPYGENLAAGYPSVQAAIDGWYAEGAKYAYQKPGFSHDTGHFSQLVWVATRKLGCASVACQGKNGTPGNFIVCEYSPRGNITNAGYFKQNVLP